MTAREPKNTERNHLLICRLCSREFQNLEVLPCLHSSCTNCLEDWISKGNNDQLAIECPVCRQIWTLLEAGMSGPHSNHILRRIVGSSGVTLASLSCQVSEEVACDGCTKIGKKISKYWCKVCSQIFCTECKYVHNNVRVTRGHQLVQIQSWTAGAETGASNHLGLKCTKHDSKIIHFCTDCDSFVCEHCHQGEGHTNHRVNIVQGATDISTSALQQMKATLSYKSHVIKHCCNKIKHMTHSLRQRREDVEVEIQNIVRERIQSLRKEENRLFHDLAEVYQRKCEVLQKQSADLNNLSLEASDSLALLSFLEDASEDNLTDFSSFCRPLKSKYQRVVDSELEMGPQENDQLFLVGNEEFQANVGEIKTSSAVAHLSRPVHLPRTLKVGQEETVMIETLDCHRNRLETGGARVSASIVSSGGEISKCKISDNDNGTYSIRYSSRIKGEHKLHITVNGEALSQCPIDIKVCGTTKKGLITKLEGDGTLHLVQPRGVDFGENGQIYVADYGIDHIAILSEEKKGDKDNDIAVIKPVGVKVVSHNKPATLIIATETELILRSPEGTKTLLLVGEDFTEISGLAYDQQNTLLYVTEKGGHVVKIYLYAKSANCLTKKKVLGGNGPSQDPGKFNSPKSLTVNRKGELYVADCENGRVQVFDRLGRFLFMFGYDKHFRPCAVCIDIEGSVFVADECGRVLKFQPEGRFVCRIDGASPVRKPCGVAVNYEKPCKLVVSDLSDSCVKIFQT
ncbi:tripartite motif-containing protein 2-like [Glandiceps talaboti]